jgi:hypothetical protein
MSDAAKPATSAGRAMILPLALAQFVASYAATNMNVAISAIAKDLNTTVSGVQTAITLFTLTMAALMIPGSKLTDIRGRKTCFIGGLSVYGVGAVLALVSQGVTLLIIGYSLLEGVGSALMIPPIYILITVVFPDIKSRAKYFGVVSGAGGLGAAAGPSSAGWYQRDQLAPCSGCRSRWWPDHRAGQEEWTRRTGPKPSFDFVGRVLSAAYCSSSSSVCCSRADSASARPGRTGPSAERS